jgi:hypothetical protein
VFGGNEDTEPVAPAHLGLLAGLEGLVVPPYRENQAVGRPGKIDHTPAHEDSSLG